VGSGAGELRIGEERFEVGPGDFAGEEAKVYPIDAGKDLFGG